MPIERKQRVNILFRLYRKDMQKAYVFAIITRLSPLPLSEYMFTYCYIKEYI